MRKRKRERGDGEIEGDKAVERNYQKGSTIKGEQIENAEMD